MISLDVDGDNITFSSDEELIFGLSARKDDVFRVYINIKRLPDEYIPTFHHPGVVCDGCNGQIKGIRYKCALCSDYDLCGHCEKSALHSQHPMLRFCSPADFEMPWMQYHLVNTQPWNGCGHSSRMRKCVNLLNSFNMRKESDTKASNGNDESEPHDENMYKDLTDIFCVMMDENFNICKRKHEQTFNPNEKQPKCPKDDSCCGNDAKESYVDKEMKDDTDKTYNELDESKMSQHMNETNFVADDADMNKAQQRNLFPAKGSDTVKQDDGITMQEEESSNFAIKNTSEQVKMNSNNDMTNSNTNTKIKKALAQMLSMGFNDEGGWLTNLLEAKDGEISKVIDIVMPYRN